MLEHTSDRVERLIPAHKLFVIVAREHLTFREVRRQLASMPPETVIIQPAIGVRPPGVLLPLLHIYKRYPQSRRRCFSFGSFRP